MLKETCNTLASIPAIGEGGCGIAALALARKIRERYNIPVGFVLLYRMFDGSDYEVNREHLAKNDDHLVVPSHIAVKVKGYILDCFGVIGKRGYAYQHEVDETRLVALIRGPGWNETFDRAYHLNYIAKRLAVDLSDIGGTNGAQDKPRSKTAGFLDFLSGWLDALRNRNKPTRMVNDEEQMDANLFGHLALMAGFDAGDTEQDEPMW